MESDSSSPRGLNTLRAMDRKPTFDDRFKLSKKTHIDRKSLHSGEWRQRAVQIDTENARLVKAVNGLSSSIDTQKYVD